MRNFDVVPSGIGISMIVGVPFDSNENSSGISAIKPLNASPSSLKVAYFSGNNFLSPFD